MSHRLHRVPRPGSPDAPIHPLLEGHGAVDREVTVELYGHEDFAEGPASWAVHLRGTPDHAADIWVALPDGVDPGICAAEDALGYVELDRDLTENREVAEIYVAVRAQHRGRGIGADLYAAAAGVAREDGRTVEQSWAFSPALAPEHPDALAAASGTGAVDRTLPSARFLLGRGYALEQAERLSTLRLDDDGLPARVRRLAAEARAASDDYDVVTWHGPTPAELADGMADLQRAMSTDVPSAGLTAEEELWDAARVARQDERDLAKGRDWVVCAARHRGTAELAGFTKLVWPASRPQGVWQEETVVTRAHRGHRLGALLKAANLDLLREVNPQARRIHTWNAAENTHVLAINDALGFEVAGLEGAWQKKG